MGLDRTKVLTAGMMAAKADIGSIAFSSTDTTVAVPTTLSFVYAGIGITTTGASGATCPVGRVTAGSVTFTRTDTTSGDVLQYIIVGN